MDPRARQRVEQSLLRPTLGKDVTNAELLASFERAVETKLAKKTIESYAASIRDAIRYFTTNGQEVPARSWSKERVWEYVHYIEANYCASFQPTPFKQHEGSALCKQRVWTGIKPVADAVREHCTNCPLFKRPTIEHRLNALNKWFKYLARVGAIPTNFMGDLVSEHYEETPRASDMQEKRRNPSVEEMRTLVNGTMHPQRRAFYAASAKWWLRPNEMLMLSRYESFGMTPPAGLPASRGFENGHKKHGTKRQNVWLKAHICTGVKTHIISDAIVTDANGGDAPQFAPLVRATAEGFLIGEVSADKAYSSRANHEAVIAVGGMPYIPFKSNATGKSHGGSLLWRKAFHLFQANREEFDQHYHKRSNVESTNSALKRKFGETLKSKNRVAQENELLCKILAYNLTVLIHEMHENGIDPTFCTPKATAAP